MKLFFFCFINSVTCDSLELKLVILAHYPPACLHCYSQSIALFCSLFGVFTLVLIHNEYRRGCNIYKPLCLGRRLYLKVQIKGTIEVAGPLWEYALFSFYAFL